MDTPPVQKISLRTCVRRPKRDCLEGLLLDDSFNGALIGASTAVGADIRIDDVSSVALGNSLNGALIGAGAALDTSVSNLVSHDITSKNYVYARYVCNVSLFYHAFRKMQLLFCGMGNKIL